MPYTRPLDRDIDRIRSKNVEGVAQLLAQLREAKTQGMMESGNTGGEREGMEGVVETEGMRLRAVLGSGAFEGVVARNASAQGKEVEALGERLDRARDRVNDALMEVERCVRRGI